MSRSKYETVRVPVLKKDEYSTWKVKMLLALEATDVDYLDRIREGPIVPKKIVPAHQEEGVEIPDDFIPKLKSEWTDDEKTAVLKDAKVRNLLHNGLDPVMSNIVIACKTAKQVWDTLEIQCSGTESIKKNRRNILIQEYEFFEAKSGESLTDIYDRFLKLLNELSLVGKEYSNEDSNSKFLRALPEEWDMQAALIRDRSDLNELSLDEIHGRLKTYELELHQRKNRRSVKARPVALKADIRSSSRRSKASVKTKEVVISDQESSDFLTPDGSPEQSADETSDGEDPDEEFEKLVAMFAKGLKKFNSRRLANKNNFRKSETGDINKLMDSKDSKQKSID